MSGSFVCLFVVFWYLSVLIFLHSIDFLFSPSRASECICYHFIFASTGIKSHVSHLIACKYIVLGVWHICYFVCGLECFHYFLFFSLVNNLFFPSRTSLHQTVTHSYQWWVLTLIFKHPNNLYIYYTLCLACLLVCLWYSGFFTILYYFIDPCSFSFSRASRGTLCYPFYVGTDFQTQFKFVNK